LDLGTGLFLDGGAIKAIHQKRIGFVRGVIRHSEETFAAKALILDLRLKYTLSAEMKRFVNAHLGCVTLAHEAVPLENFLEKEMERGHAVLDGAGRQLLVAQHVQLERSQRAGGSTSDGVPCKASSERAALNLKRFACFLPDTRLFWA